MEKLLQTIQADKNGQHPSVLFASGRSILASIDAEIEKAPDMKGRNKFIKPRKIAEGIIKVAKVTMDKNKQLGALVKNCREEPDSVEKAECVDKDKWSPPRGIIPSKIPPRQALVRKAKTGNTVSRRSEKTSRRSKSVKGQKGKEVGEEKSNAPIAVTKPSVESGLADLIRSSIPAESPDVEWDDVIGLSELKRSLLTSVVVSQRRVKLFVGLRKPKKSFLLYGPPGTGKTLVVKAIAKASGFVFFNVLPSVVTSKFRGESEKLISSLFEVAKSYEKAIIFFDEIDSLAMKRGGQSEHEASRRFMSEFLVRLQECSEGHNNVYIFAATNRPWDIDSAVLRRFQVKSYVPLPTREDRCLILKRLLVEHTLTPTFDFEEISGHLEGYSPSDIRNICSSAANYPLDEYLGGFNDSVLNKSSFLDVSVDLPIGETHFLKAIGMTPKSVTKDELKEFEKYMEH
uniref:AAA domain-containing protein n=1 Tax=Rhabditophanes sp. KR3021 TaxID=114890 RepID=A0AC35UFL6_9BILA